MAVGKDFFFLNLSFRESFNNLSDQFGRSDLILGGSLTTSDIYLLVPPVVFCVLFV